MKNKETKKGFTLAETLIALAVLGILAAVTVPVLVQSTNKHTYVDGLKKAYGILKVATSQLSANNSGTMNNLATTNNAMVDKYCSILNCVKKCYNSTTGCFSGSVTSVYRWLKGDSDTNTYPWGDGHADAILSNGLSISFDIECDPNDWSYRLISVDINGLNKPNTVGRDIFSFYIRDNTVMPFGTPQDPVSYYADWSSSCNPTRAGSGDGCAGKVLIEGKMNY